MLRSIVVVILVTLSALPFVLFSLLMVAVFFSSRDAEKITKKAIATLSGLICPACDRIYGMEAAKLAKQEHIDRSQDSRKANPHLRINFARYWLVRCPNCQTTARFYYETEQLR